MVDNILGSIKDLLNIPIEYKNFDNDILIHINSAFALLNQLGVGTEEGFLVDEDSKWSQFLPDDQKNLNLVVTYVYLKVRLIFDPPVSSSVMESINRQINELEWRLNAAIDIPTDR